MLSEYAQFIHDLERFCIGRGFEIAGTCYSEGIYGEITVVRIGEEANWSRWDEHKFNFTPPETDNAFLYSG
jgi:hypothetical protein